MSAEHGIRKIVAAFLKVDESEISPQTVVDRSAVKGSIMVHRMHAAISRELGTGAKDYTSLKTFGDLLGLYGLAGATTQAAPSVPEAKVGVNAPRAKRNLCVGIDMESIEKMPKVEDFSNDTFYQQNFSPKEISYCLQKTDPLQSFTGIFAAKEAIVKADNALRGKPFCQIEIGHDEGGRPHHADFALSISHAGQLAVAVAVRIQEFKLE